MYPFLLTVYSNPPPLLDWLKDVPELIIVLEFAKPDGHSIQSLDINTSLFEYLLGFFEFDYLRPFSTGSKDIFSHSEACTIGG